MARIRTIKPGFFRHEVLFEAERASGLPIRVAFAGLWTVADRDGRFKWQPNVIKLDVLPFDDVDFAAVLDALERAGLIVRYEVDGVQYGHIPTFAKHQHVNAREIASDIPAPVQAGARTRKHQPKRVQERGEYGTGTGTGTEEKPVEVETSTNVAPSQASGAAPVLVQDEEPEGSDIPALLDRRRYPEAFEALWSEYRPIASPNATKADAHRAWQRLSAADREACWTGVVRYVVWLIEARRKRPDFPAKHLATFINRRGWETFEEEAA